MFDFPIQKSLAIVGLLFLCSPLQAQKVRKRRIQLPTRIHHVRATATGIGSGADWSNAFDDLQLALAIAKAGDQIWVAAGLYVPTPAGGPQSATFLVPSGVALYGGFDGAETRLDQRDVESNTTILSGDINRDDVTFPTFNIVSANCWNIVTMRDASSATRLDGFELQTGHILGAPYPQRYGAGLHLENSSPTVAQCTFSFCVAERGGAIYSDLGSPMIEACSFSNNFASGSTAAGAAICSDGGVMQVSDSVFNFNEAEGIQVRGLGGAIYNKLGSTFVEGCSFSSNTALNRGNAGYTPSFGGALYVESGFARISSSLFFNNLSNVGGAVALNVNGTPTCELLNDVFIGSTVLPILLSSGLEAGGDAGTIYSGPNCTLDLIGSLVYGGFGDNNGGAAVGGAGRVANSIFWNNRDKKGQIGRSQVKADLVESCCVMNMLVGEPGEDPPDPQKFPGSIALDPLFADIAMGDYRLLPSSPCIDAGDNSLWPLFLNADFDGNPRFVDDPEVMDTGVGPAPVGDMGPFEANY